MREVEAERKACQRKEGDRGAELLDRHMTPVILGPNDRYHVSTITRALYQERVKSVMVTVVATLRRLLSEASWFVLDNHSWVTSVRRSGQAPWLRRHSEVGQGPDRQLVRPLTGELRRAGGFAKDTTLSSEFLWDDFLRRRMKRKAVPPSIASGRCCSVQMAETTLFVKLTDNKAG